MDVESVERIANADRSLDTAHFSPALWREHNDKPEMFAGFVQDHKIIGMSKAELFKLLGPAYDYTESSQNFASYGLNRGFTCGKASRSVSFRFNKDKVDAWRTQGGGAISDWHTSEPSPDAFP